jgi:hypothetical protein
VEPAARIEYRARMQTISIAGTRLLLETAEAGTRYHAPVLIVPGLFQSEACWRGIISMLAHRGWDVFLLTRPSDDPDHGWDQSVQQVSEVAEGVASSVGKTGNVVMLGADVGACVALTVSQQVESLALGLFAPCEPLHAASAYDRAMGMLERRRARRHEGPVQAPRPVAKTSHDTALVGEEPVRWMKDLAASSPFELPHRHPPAIVFNCDNDLLVDGDRCVNFARGEFARESKTRLNGRFWPAIGWERACDDFHRFLILTLSDRVVEFPEEILSD